MVSHTNASGTNVLTQLLKPAITQFTSRHFNAYLVQFGIFACIKMSTMQLNAKPSTELYAERLVPI